MIVAIQQNQGSEPKRINYLNAAVIPLLFALITVPSLQTFAQTAQPSMRTYVSGKGSNNGQCTQSLPCRTLQAAVDLTSPGGEVYVLDSADYGPLIIAKSISVTSAGTIAGVLVQSGVSAITINAGAGDIVNLRGLDVDGAQSGMFGIRFVSGGSLSIQGSVIRNFIHGVFFAPNGRSSLFMWNTEVTNNKGVGIVATSTAKGVLSRVRTSANAVGIVAWGADANLTVSDTIADKNVYGIAAIASATTTIKNAVISDNTIAVAADQSGIVRISGSTLTSNATGLYTTDSGQVQSFGNNDFSSNTTDGTANATLTLQ